MEQNLQKMTAMTLNVQCWNITPERLANLCVMVRKYMPDLLGVQEATPQWMETLREALPEYACVGVGREKKLDGEASAIFYKKDLFTQIASATNWLSETPYVAGSKLPDSDYVRVISWVLLHRNSDGKPFLHVNTHLNWGDVQVRQLNILFDRIKEMSDVDTLLTGDFNADSRGPGYPLILKNGFADTHELAAEKNQEDNSNEIDYLFLRAAQVEVLKHHRCEEPINGEAISDHYPVYIEMII